MITNVHKVTTLMNVEAHNNALNTGIESMPGELLDLFDRLTEIVRVGDHDDVEELLKGHPEHAARLRAVLPALGVMTCLKHDNGPLSGRHQAIDQTEGLPARSPEMRRAPAERDESVLGDFRLLREIGRGGMGIVYEAEQLSLRRRVAVKVLPLAGVLDQRALARFKNEATAAATLFHPHIVPVFFVGSERSVHFYAMQLIEGQSLAEVIHGMRKDVAEAASFREKRITPRATIETESCKAREGASRGRLTTDHSPLTSNQSEIRNQKSQIDTQAIAALSTDYSNSPKRYFRRVAEIGVQIAQALEHAHEHGILHRDVKPANILLDAEGKAWITDFGLARLEADASKTFTGDLVGTLRYMSPEQALAKRVAVDQRTDVYSLSATLYELLALVPVYQETDRQALMRQIAFEEPRRPRKRNPAIPQELDTIVVKGLEKNPDHRYDSARQLADDLQRYLNNQPILASPPSLMHCCRKWVWRHSGLVTSAAVTMLLVSILLFVGIGLLSVAYQKEAQLRTEAETHKRAAVRQTERARDNLQQTLTAIDRVLVRMAENDLTEIPGTAKARQDLLKDALALCQDLKRGNRDDPLVLSKIAEIYMRISDLEVSVNALMKGLSSAAQAFGIYRELCQEDPENLPLLQSMLRAYAQIKKAENAANIFAGDETPDLDTILRALEKLRSRDTTPSSLWIETQVILGARSELTWNRGDQFQTALDDLLQRVKAAFSTSQDRDLSRALLMLYRERALIAREADYTSGAEYFRRAVPLARSEAEVTGDTNDLTRCLLEWQDQLCVLGRHGEAREVLAEAEQLAWDGLQRFPESAERRYHLAWVHFEQGKLEVAMGRFKAAVPALRESLRLWTEAWEEHGILKKEGNPEIAAVKLADTLELAGHPADAEEVYDITNQDLAEWIPATDERGYSFRLRMMRVTLCESYALFAIRHGEYDKAHELLGTAHEDYLYLVRTYDCKDDNDCVLYRFKLLARFLSIVPIPELQEPSRLRQILEDWKQARHRWWQGGEFYEAILEIRLGNYETGLSKLRASPSNEAEYFIFRAIAEAHVGNHKEALDYCHRAFESVAHRDSASGRVHVEFAVLQLAEALDMEPTASALTLPWRMPTAAATGRGNPSEEQE